MLPFADEIDRAHIEAEVPKTTEPNGVFILRAARIRNDFGQNLECLFDLLRRRVVRQSQHDLHFP